MWNKLINEKETIKIKPNLEEKDNNTNVFFAKFYKSCLITYIGIIFGVLSMYFAFVKMAFIEECYIRYSLICLILAGVCDMFDGKFARSCKRTEEEKIFGVQLDSLADTICFIATPIVIMMSMGLTQWYYLISYILFIICGISRLGYFNIKSDGDTAIKTYNGLPVTSVAIIYPLIGLLHLTISSMSILSVIYWIVTIVVAILFVVNIKIPKLKGIAYVIVPIIAVAGIIALLILK